MKTIDVLDRSVLVTGGSGFIGRHLCGRLFNLGARVHSVDLKPFPPPIASSDVPVYVKETIGDICYQPVIEHVVQEAKPEIIFHLAGVSQVGDCYEYPVASVFTNTIGTLLVLEACRGHDDIRLVVSTTDKVYGQRDREDHSLEAERAMQFGFSERDAFRPRHAYEASKGAADLLCQAYAHSYGVRVGVLRCGNVFGPYDLNLDRLIPSVLGDLCLGISPRLRTKSPNSRREYLYVDDAVDAFLRVGGHLERAPYGFFNVSAGESRTVLEIVDALKALIPERSGLTPHFFDEQGAKHESEFIKLNSIALRQATGWTANTPFAVGLQRTARWYQEYFGGLAGING